MPLVSIEIVAGKSPAYKKALLGGVHAALVHAIKIPQDDRNQRLYKAIVSNLGRDPGIDGSDIMIVLHELPLENWGIRGGKPGSEVDLGSRLTYDRLNRCV
jgi:phenylpyruvate tautomerase PptA (4-oxalocrotonate tautomerase family)